MMHEIVLLLWTAKQTGQALGDTEDCIKNLYRVKKLKGHPIGRSLRFRSQDVQKYVEDLGGEN